MNTVTPSTRRWFSTLFAGIAAAVLLVSSLPASAAAETPKDFIKEETQQVTELLAKDESEQRSKKFSQKAQELIDFEMLASRALGKHWEERSEEERKQFLSLLQKLLEANYKRKLEGKTFGEDFEIKYLEIKQRDDRAFVKTRVIWGPKEKEQKPVSYKLVNQSGEWVIYDVVIDDISLEATYRDSYTEIIEKEGWDALIEKMKKKVEQLREQADTEEAKKAEAGGSE